MTEKTGKRILVLPGDGVGRDLMPGTVASLDQLTRKHGVELEWIVRDCGAQCHLETGAALSPETRALAKEVDAVLLGAVGLPDVRRPDGTEIADEVVLDLRADLDVYANVRPVRSWPNVPGPVGKQNINYILVRENTEGLYASRLGGVVLRDEVATDTMIITRFCTERVVRNAFELALRSEGRPSDGKKVVTCVDKANTLKSYVLFRTVFDQVAKEYDGVVAEHEHADAMAARMVLNPDTLNVLVCENMLGDILSDLAAASVGGLGLAPSGSVGDRHGLFEPTHGSAPGIAGKDIANPVAMLMSAAMMLRWLGERDQSFPGAELGATLERSIEQVFSRSILTQDLGGRQGTQEFFKALESCWK